MNVVPLYIFLTEEDALSEGFNKKGLCKLCNEPRTEAGHDPCIADLPGVVYACCGHGRTEGYLKFEDGRCLRFKPTRVDLDVAQYEIVIAPNPIHNKDEPYRVLSLKTGKVTTKVNKHDVIAMGDRRVTVRRRDA